MFERIIMEDNTREIQYCFPNNNLSCIREVKPEVEYIILYILNVSLSVFTVFLNLLVIISISHFKKLHTPTNLLILSLAVADLIVGLIVIPLMGIRFIESCWYFGEAFCLVFSFLVFTVVQASLGNLVFISVDRYIAVTDPLRYTVRVTNNKVIFCLIINWLSSTTYSVIIFCDALFYPETQDRCYGECTVTFKYEYAITDLIVTLVAPCSVIMSLYVKIFCVAKYQAKFVNSVTGASRSQRKAAKTLGIVVVVYFMCWIPYYIVILLEGYQSTESVEFNITCWIVYINSCMNPLIYALFYRWFRISAKHILTLKIFKPSSEYLNLFPEEN
ncbi:trace amine-associated receptor 13c-like [Myxocyprinus asiaticus]|uniref:trace amine-associated receptor 13c-like n=1 Tax=Myxocyprinus asiaticus TaxID=70543 RepID=UPI0022221A7B|nr:trace amine-associated receptor 13c-like [Myxocyprinus asiaticus]